MKNDANHPGWMLSRECIRDTMLAKRSGALHDATQLIKSSYAINIRALRETQLAPYREVMRAGRYQDKYFLKTASEVVIIIRRGMVEEVRANNPYTSVWIADYDDNGSGSHADELEDAEERGNAPDMYRVY